MVLDDGEQTTSRVTKTLSHSVEPYLQNKRSSIFYKLIVASIIQDRKLRIPDRFIRKFGDELSSTAKLTILNGRAWLVELRKDNHKLWFDNGWHEFVEDCSIHVGYLLVFKYQGYSNFSVHILNLATSEIKYPWDTCLEQPSHAKKCPLEKYIEDINSVEKLASSPSCPTPSSSINKAFYESICYNWNNNFKFGVSLENLHPVEEVCHLEATCCSTRDVGTQLNDSELTAVDEVELHYDGVTGGEWTRSKQRTDPCVHESLGKRKVEAELHDRKHSLRNWRAVATVKKCKTVCAAELFKSDHPFFRVILRPYNISIGFIYLHIPATFARKYLNGFRGYITLMDSDSNRQWLVQCLSKDGRVDLYKGWSEYVRDNNLDKGDVCVFELIRTDDVALKVTIFRVLKDRTQ